MTHTRYWAMMLATAICGAFIAIEKFAFAPSAAVWIAFGVAIAATVLSTAALLVALLRENHAFSGFSALAALVAGWTIIDTQVFADRAALWIAFAGGVALLVLALRALALHETTVERVVHDLEAPDTPASEPALALSASLSSAGSLRALIEPGRTMRSWMYWLAHTGLALAGGFVVLMTFALTVPGHHHASAQWLAFGIGVAATCVALGALVDQLLPGLRPGASDRGRSERLAPIVLSAGSLSAAIAMVVCMAAFGFTPARWIAFGLGCALVGISLLASTVHELTTERVRHELAIAEAVPAPAPVSPAA